MNRRRMLLSMMAAAATPLALSTMTGLGWAALFPNDAGGAYPLRYPRIHRTGIAFGAYDPRGDFKNERAVEIDLFAYLFVLRFAARAGHVGGELTEAASASLAKYEWPANVRELRNAIKHAVTMSRGGVIDVTSLPEPLRRRPSARAIKL